MRKFVSTALLGLATTAGVLLPTAAHATVADLGDRIDACVAGYDSSAAGAVDALDRCIDDAIAGFRADDSTTVVAPVSGESGNTGIFGNASDGGVNTGILGNACGEGSFNSGILGSAGC